MITKKLASIFLTGALTSQFCAVLAVPPHAAPPGAEERQLLDSISEKLRKPPVPNASSSWWSSWFGSWFGEKKETLEIQNAPFKDYFEFFYTIFTALNSLGYGERLDAESATELAEFELHAILHAAKFPEELNAEKFKEYSDQIEHIKLLLRSSMQVGDCESKAALLREIESFLNKFFSHLSKEKIGFRELSDRYDCFEVHCSNAARLRQLYFDRVSKVGRPRILIVGNGRAVETKVFMDNLIIDPSYKYSYSRSAGFYRHNPYFFSDDFVLGTIPYDEEYYKESRYDYFLTDIDRNVRPDICTDMEDLSSVAKLGENEWDYVMFEGFYSEKAVAVAKKILKPGGSLLLDSPGKASCHLGPFPAYNPPGVEGLFPYNVYLIYKK